MWGKKEKKAKTGEQRPRRNLKATEEKLKAKLAKKGAKKERSKRRLNRMKGKLDEMESECGRLRETKEAMEQTVAIQLSVEYMLVALLCGGEGGC